MSNYSSYVGGPILFGYLAIPRPPGPPIMVEIIAAGAITVDTGQAAITKEIISKTVTLEIEG